MKTIVLLITFALLSAMPAYSGNDASFISQNVPATLSPGQTAIVSVTMKNNGTTKWTSASGYKLGFQNPQDTTFWGFGNRVTLAPNQVVVPGQQITFGFSIRAPSTSGNYNFQMRMLREAVEWFGGFTTNISIRVGSGSSTLQDLFNGRARFVTDQSSVPLQNQKSGHREAFAVNRTDLGANTVLLYHRIFQISAANPEIALARSDDGGRSWGPSSRIITLSGGHFSVAPSVVKVGNMWWMTYEEDGGGMYASSQDGLTWTKLGSLFSGEIVSTPSLFVQNDTFYVFYGTQKPNTGKVLTLKYRKGPSLSSLSAGTDAFSAGQTGWPTKSVSFPRVISQRESDGRLAYYLFFEAASDNWECNGINGNKFGWGVARSYDLTRWSACQENPIEMNGGGCGLDMPNPFIRYDGQIFVYHTSADTRQIVRTHLEGR